MTSEIRIIRITKDYETPVPPATRRGPQKKKEKSEIGSGPIARINRNKRLKELREERDKNG